MEQHASKILNNCFNTNIYSYLQTSGGQILNQRLNVVQLKTVVFLHWCLLCAVLLEPFLSRLDLMGQRYHRTKIKSGKFILLAHAYFA